METPQSEQSDPKPAATRPVPDGLVPDNSPDLIEMALALLEAGLDTLTAADADTLDNIVTAHTARLRSIEDRIHTTRLRLLPRIDDDGRWALDGSRSFAHWLSRTQNVTLGTARREVRTARALRDTLPATAAAATAGTIGTDHLRALVDIAPTSPARRDALAAPVDNGDGDIRDEQSADQGTPAARPTGEEHLLSLAVTHPIETFRRLVRRFAHVADPDADDRGYIKAREKEFLEVSPTFDGYHLAGFLTLEHGQALQTALNTVMGPPAAADTRTTTQRRAQALADLTRIALDNATIGTGAAVRPHLNVTVSYTELLALTSSSGTTDPTSTRTSTPPAFPDHGTPIPRALLKRLACDSEISRIVFGPDSQILDVGRRQRTITGQLRRAVIARDHHCTWPGCHEPPSRCEVHHAITHWADGGNTSVHNAALLCWHHHDRVDTHGITMRWHHGHWQFHDRHGRKIPGAEITGAVTSQPKPTAQPRAA